MAMSGAFSHTGCAVTCCSTQQPAGRFSYRSRHRLPTLGYRSPCSVHCHQLSRSAEDEANIPCNVTTCSSASTDDVTMLDYNRIPGRRICLLALAGLSSNLMMSQQAAAIPLAPLGNSSDTIGGPKLQQPSLKQVQVNCFARRILQNQI